MEDLKQYLDLLAESGGGQDPSTVVVQLKNGQYVRPADLEQLVKDQYQKHTKDGWITLDEPEEPNWDEIRNLCHEILTQSRDLNTITALSLAMLRLEGFSGFQQGLWLIKEALAGFWESVHPRLDEEDGDATERVNTLMNLSQIEGADGDPYQCVRRIKQTPLCHSAQVGRFGLLDIEASEAGDSPVNANQIDAAFRDTPENNRRATYDAVGNSISLINEIDRVLGEKLGTEQTPSWQTLLATLERCRRCLEPYVQSGVEANETGSSVSERPQTEASTMGPTGPAAKQSPGIDLNGNAVQTRKEIAQVLDQICEYYNKNEPSSPVPYLVRGARRLMECNIIEVHEAVGGESGLELLKKIGGDEEEASR